MSCYIHARTHKNKRMMPVQTPSQSLLFRQIQNDDFLSKFSLGDASKVALKIFIQKEALEFHQKEIAKTYVLVDEANRNRVFGYISIVCSEINIATAYDVDESLRVNKYKTFSAVKIVRFALDKALQRKGYGTQMAAWCMSLVKDRIMPLVGCRFLIVDAKADVVTFYERIGFTILDTEENKGTEHPLMFLDLYKLQ